MSTLLKDLYSPAFYSTFSEVLAEVVSGFDKRKFTRLIFDKDWEDRELKQRMRHTTLVLHQFLSPDFKKAARQIEKILASFRKRKVGEQAVEYMFLPDYIEVFGLEDYHSSVALLEQVTQFTSCEFAVRPFIIRYQSAMMKAMLHWSRHESHHVRRLASEGSRPRLPWAIALPSFKADPAPLLPILETLKNDPSEYVRRSVANSLNDIAKDNPAIVIRLARKWKGSSPETDALIKHGCRTLLKQGNKEVLNLFGHGDSSKIAVQQFALKSKKVKIGGELSFSFLLTNTGKAEQPARLEYGIYYLRQNGEHSKKVFKLSERLLQAGETLEGSRRQSFRIITTRQFYPGPHRVSFIVNGEEKAFAAFELSK